MSETPPNPSAKRQERIAELYGYLVATGADGMAEHSVDPPPGHMSVEEIATIPTESELDARIAAQFPKGVNVFKTAPYPNDEQRRIEIKTLVLARLMGISSRSQALLVLFTPEEDSENVSDNLDKWVKRHTTPECQRRISDVWKEIARGAGALVLTPQNQEIMNMITRILNEKKLQPSPPLTPLDILNIDNLPRHDVSDAPPTDKDQWDISKVLRLYYLCLTLGDWHNIAARWPANEWALRKVYERRVGERAKVVVKKMRSSSSFRPKS